MLNISTGAVTIIELNVNILVVTVLQVMFFLTKWKKPLKPPEDIVATLTVISHV